MIYALLLCCAGQASLCPGGSRVASEPAPLLPTADEIESLKAHLRLDLRKYAREFIERELKKTARLRVVREGNLLTFPREVYDDEESEIQIKKHTFDLNYSKYIMFVLLILLGAACLWGQREVRNE